MKTERSQEQSLNEIAYDKSTMKVFVLACFIIVAAVLFTGVISYSITETAVVEKVKSRDMVYSIESISSKIDGRIDRAKETSRILANDPEILQWVAGGETNERQGAHAKQKISEIASRYDYSNSFIVSAVTGQYWAEGGKLIDVMSESDPDDIWFFEAIKAEKPVDLLIDYNAERADTFVFVNALMKHQGKAIGITGVGLSLKDIAKDFQTFKVGEKSNLWLVDRRGKIHLSEDIEHNGKHLGDFLPGQVVGEISSHLGDRSIKPNTLEYFDHNGATVDLVYASAKSSDWTIVFQIPRRESVAMLSSIKTNTAAASVISLSLIIFIFYLISNRMANPLKRAVKLSQKMERLVRERTSQLAETNQKIMDSIDYAKRIQTSVLPTSGELELAFTDHFVIWQPRDVVGGDFYWLRRSEDGCLLVVGDCTGHGVPGAFMTMAVNSILNHIVDETPWNDPAAILKKLNDRVRETIHRTNSDQITDDGLDIAICYLGSGGQLVFAGAKIPLFVCRGEVVRMIAGARKSIGCKRSSSGVDCSNIKLELDNEDVCYITTDGFLDQNGGSRDYPFGRRRFTQTICTLAEQPLIEQKRQLELALSGYMSDEAQRDDITLVAFKILVDVKGEHDDDKPR